MMRPMAPRSTAGAHRRVFVAVPSNPNEPLGMNRIKQAHKGTTAAVSDGWVTGGSFFTSILAGTLVGWGLDVWWGTDPILVVVGVVAGSITGFYRMWDSVAAPQGKEDIFDGR